MKIGLTGSISSGKTTASKIISKNRGPLFSADQSVKKLYKKIFLRRRISAKFKFLLNSKFKKKLKNKIISNQKNLKVLEKIIHPLVRQEMISFLKKNKNKKFLFLEIPLLIENKLTKYFDIIIFIKSNKNLRLKRYMQKGGSKSFFTLLDNSQLKDYKKMQLCDHIVVNNKSLSVLNNKVLNIIKSYE